MAELRREPTIPADMAIAPALGPIRPRPVQRHAALLVNPFSAKDPRASFGKHVLTPTLALTSIAGAMPLHWTCSTGTRISCRVRRPRTHCRSSSVRAHGAVNRREPARMRDLSHPDALSGYAAVPSVGNTGRILHRDWDKYDTAHVVFQPKHMSCEDLDRGYAWCYDRLFSRTSIWKRRPRDSRAVLAYLAMSYLYKRSNRFWHVLIKHRLTAATWRPLIEHSRQRHLKLRPRLDALGRADEAAARASQCVSAGV